MKHETIFLNHFFEGIKTDATLTTYVRSNSEEIEPQRKRASVLICPGGGYYCTVDREAEPIALAFMAKGYNAFVLRYSTRDKTEETYPTQLLEASAAIAYIRRNSEKYHVNRNAVMVCGFSAGGHLAACLGTLWNESVVTQKLGLSERENRPDGMILGYPVITSGKYANKGSFENLLGNRAEQIILEKLSLENQVDSQTPPAFIWHTLNDDTVPSENSFLFAEALKKSGVSFEMHIYPEGVHGLGLGSRETRDIDFNRENSHVESWFDLCAAWIARYIEKDDGMGSQCPYCS